MYDQFGRVWTASIGNRSGAVCGMIQPGFSAPWYPDAQFLIPNPDNISELWIDHEAMLSRRKVRLDEYHNEAVALCREKNLPAPSRGEYPQQIIDRIGQPPKAIEPIVAAMQENPWILGFTPVVDPRLARFVLKATPTAEILDSYDFGPRSFAEAKAAAASAPTEALADVAPTEDAALEEQFEEIGGENTVDVDALLLDDIEDEFDAEASGGRTVAPKNTDRAARQAPRRQSSTPVRKRHGSSRSSQAKRQRGNRPTLASGAAPVIGDGSI